MEEMVSKAEHNPHKLASLLRDKVENHMPDLGGPLAGFIKAALSNVDWGFLAVDLVRNSQAAKPDTEIAAEATN